MPKKTSSRLKRMGLSPARSEGRDAGVDDSCHMSSIPSSGAISSLSEPFDGGAELYEDELKENWRSGGDVISLGHTDFVPQMINRHPGDLEGDMEEAMNAVCEKRGDTRLQGLNSLCRCFQHILHAEFILARKGTLISSLLACLKKARAEEEKILTNKALSSLFVRLGPDEDEIVYRCLGPLRSFLGNSRNNGPLSRAASATALSMCCFMCSTDDSVTEETMTYLSLIFTNIWEEDVENGDNATDSLDGIEAMLVAAMKGWALLATTALRSVCLDMLPTLCGLLDSPCPDVRNTAGESLAMLYELHFVPSMECDDDEEEGEGGGGAQSDETASDKSSSNTCWDEVSIKVSKLLNVSTKRINKSVKRTQRQFFSSIDNTINKGIPPEEVMKFPCGIIEARSWSMVLVFHAIRDCLGSGLQTQVQVDEVLRDMLNVQKWGDVRGRAEIHGKSGACSKMRTEERNKQRRGRDHERHSALWTE